MTKQQSKRGGVKPIKAWAVMIDGCLVYETIVSRFLDSKDEVMFPAIGDRYLRYELLHYLRKRKLGGLSKKAKIIPVLITPLIKKARASAQIKRQ